MDISIFQQKDFFPSLIISKLAAADIDYHEKHVSIRKSNKQGAPHLEAGVAVLLHYKPIGEKSEYVFQLIKRSAKVAQAGDISCPGGMLLPGTDKLLSFFLKTGIIPAMRGQNPAAAIFKDKNTASLIRLFTANSLREAWEEIGLNPFNVSFLGALPSYSLTSFARTIFPVVCLTHKSFEYKLNQEVEKILEIPLSSFFQSSNYALLEISTVQGNNVYGENSKFPCMVIPDETGDSDILWGATFYIITNFLRVIFGDTLPISSVHKKVNKTITDSYLSGNSPDNGHIKN